MVSNHQVTSRPVSDYGSLGTILHRKNENIFPSILLTITVSFIVFCYEYDWYQPIICGKIVLHDAGLQHIKVGDHWSKRWVSLSQIYLDMVTISVAYLRWYYFPKIHLWEYWLCWNLGKLSNIIQEKLLKQAKGKGHLLFLNIHPIQCKEPLKVVWM